MDDYFHIQFSSTENCAHALSNYSQELHQVVERLQGVVRDLYASGLQGSFVSTLDARCQNLVNALRYLGDEGSEAGRDLLTVVSMARELNAEYARRFAEGDRPTALPTSQLGFLNSFSGGGLGGGGGDTWSSGPELHGVEMGAFPNKRFPTQMDLLHEYLDGNLTYEEASVLMNAASLDPVWRNRIDVEAELWEKRLAEGQFAHTQGTLVEGEFGSVTGSVLSGEHDVGVKASFGRDGLDLGADAKLGLYAARIQGGAEWNGFNAVGDAYVGATASGQAGLTINPLDGEVSAVAKAEAFAGAEAKGSIGFEHELFSLEVQGGVSIGAGAKGALELSFEDGELVCEAAALASVGVGGGGGFKVRFDVVDCGKLALQGIGYQLGPVASALDAVLP